MSLTRKLLKWAGLGVAAALLGILFLDWLNWSRPAWVLTATNNHVGVDVVLTTEHSDKRVYHVLIPLATLDQPVTGKQRSDITSPDVRTVFYDDTLRPGRWKFVVAGVEIDVMPARIIVNGEDVSDRPLDIVVDGKSGSIMD